MRRALKWIGWSIAALIAASAVLVIVLLVGANTPRGQTLIARLAPRLTGGLVTIEGLSGRFPDRLKAAGGVSGIALAADKPAVGVSTLSAYAAPHMAADERFQVVAAIDARHAHVYLQVFSPGGRTLTAPRLAALGDAVQAAAATPSCIVGSAAQSVAAALSRSHAALAAVDARAAPDITWVARMGAVVPEDHAPLKPQYLRAADAQPQNAAQLPRR